MWDVGGQRLEVGVGGCVGDVATSAIVFPLGSLLGSWRRMGPEAAGDAAALAALCGGGAACFAAFCSAAASVF